MQNQENPTNQPADGGGDVDLLALVGWVWRRRLIFVLMAFMGAVLAVGYSYTVTKRYTATVMLLPKIPAQQEGLFAQLANLSKVTEARERINESLYGKVLSSDLILDRVIDRKWKTAVGDSVTMFEIFGMGASEEGESSSYREYQLRKILRRKLVSFNRDQMTGVMHISATIPGDPILAAEVANYLADEVQAYNAGLNSKRAVKHQEFVEGRLVEVQGKLEEAEKELTVFIGQNTRYASSPSLSQRHKELEREAQALRRIWLQLREQLETAIIDVNKELDSINILDRATPPFRKSSPKRSLFLIVGGLLGGLLAFPVGILRGRRE